MLKVKLEPGLRVGRDTLYTFRGELLLLKAIQEHGSRGALHRRGSPGQHLRSNARGESRVLKVATAFAAAMACMSLLAATLEPWIGGATPELRGRTLADQSFDLAGYKGRTVIVNF